jgi:formylglycine-generating enzyme required for sulfatase activity
MGEADPASVSGFRLDKYLVTVGRFRHFAALWSNGSGWFPPQGSGKHTHLNCGQGLSDSASAGGYETGWQSSDNFHVAPTTANLTCDSSYATWTDTAGSQENLPINCVNWYEAYAFCIWDGGFLPSEAEWECAAAGGNEQREYPWGSDPPGTSNHYAIYGCYGGGGTGPSTCTGVSNIAPVGFASQGAGRWGQFDLAGELWEWNVDLFANNYVIPCVDCAYLANTSSRVLRGGNFYMYSSYLAPANRNSNYPPVRYFHIGFRCARTP